MNETLKFPILGIGPAIGKYAKAGEDVTYPFLTRGQFYEMQRFELRRGDRAGMLVIDSNLRCWKVARVIDLGVTDTGLLAKVLGTIFNTQTHGLDYELTALAPMTIEQARDRVEAAIRSNLGEWALEDNPDDLSPEGRKLIEGLVAQVHAAPTLQQIIEALETVHDDDLDDEDAGDD